MQAAPIIARPHKTHKKAVAMYRFVTPSVEETRRVWRGWVRKIERATVCVWHLLFVFHNLYSNRHNSYGRMSVLFSGGGSSANPGIQLKGVLALIISGERRTRNG